MVANVAGDLLAYRNRCAGCGGALDHGDLSGGTLHCPSCARGFELPRAGRCASEDGCSSSRCRCCARTAAESGWRVARMTPYGRRRRLSARRRANLVTGLRRFLPGRAAAARRRRSAGADEQCELCTLTLAAKHRHLLHLDERRILCVCETCWAVRSGEAEFRPVGNRTVWLDDFALTDEQWASFQIPIGLAFFMVSTVSGGVVALYPSPAGATECELDLEAWAAARAPRTRCWPTSRPTPRR